MNTSNDFSVLLINPPGRCLIGKDGVVTERKHCTPPLGLAYLAGSLLKANIKVSILDMLAEGYENERFQDNFIYYGLDFDAAICKIGSCRPNIIGISLLFSNLAKETFRLCTAIKQVFPEIPIVLGGHHPSAMPHVVMENQNIDFVLTGEADLTFVELCESLASDLPLDKIKGLFWRKEKQVIDNLKGVHSEYIGVDFKYYNRKNGSNPSELESLPLPAWNLFPMDKYWSTEVRMGASDVLSIRYAVMVSTRGCPHICNFCTSPLMGGFKNYRKRDNDDVIAEIKWLHDEFNVAEIQFLDDNFFVSKLRVKDLCRRLATNFPDMKFSVPAGTEINALDNEMIDLLANANFYRLTLAIESANPDIQSEQIDKHVNLDRIPELIQYAKNNGIEVRAFFMIGFPGESRESVLQTAEFALSLNLDDIALSVVTPLPGTPIGDETLSKKQLRDDFNPNDIRYSVSSIRIEGMSADELEDVRRNTWLAHQSRKAIKNSQTTNVNIDCAKAAKFATAGFANKARVGFSGYVSKSNLVV